MVETSGHTSVPNSKLSTPPVLTSQDIFWWGHVLHAENSRHVNFHLAPKASLNKFRWYLELHQSKNTTKYGTYDHRLIKAQIGHARDFAWYRGQRPSPARVILSHKRVQINVRENLCSYATNLPHFRVRGLLLCGILITRAGDGRWPRYQAKSLACPGCAYDL